MRHARYVLMLLVSTAYLAVPVVAQGPQPGSVAFEPYTVESFDGRKADAQLGRLYVRENRANPSSKVIRLAFVRLAARSAQPGPPTVFLAGGPGVPGTVMGRIPPYFDLFDKLRDVGDVILLDQRGSGMSEPALDCPATVAPPVDVLESEAKSLDYVVGRAGACLDSWRSKGVDVSAYTTDESADDVEDLRLALKVERLNVLGLSYGTELALAYVRLHGDHLNRVALAATRGPDDELLLPAVLDIQIKKLSRLVAADPGMGKLVPDLDALLRQLLAQFATKPVTLTVKDRLSGRMVDVLVGKFVLQAIVQGDLADARAFAKLPAFLYTISRGDNTLLTSRVEGLYNGIVSQSAMSIGMNCSYGSTLSRRELIRAEAASSPLGDVMNFSWPEICDTVVKRAPRTSPMPLLWSAVPTLFLSATLDSTTPPQQAEAIRWGFPNGTHIIVENGGHETLPIDQVQAIVVDFLKGADVSARSVHLAVPHFASPDELKPR